ncbi:MAG: hypothetical protein J6I70_04270 [Bacteroidaceae bacterium]|nr:hypothetical protein [Bacteroidaceae bacterium]
MFDKVIIKARIDTADIDTIVLRNYLEQCTEGDELFYKSTAYANFEGCFIEVRGNTLKCKCSINKLYEKELSGKLDNSKPMTFRNAVRVIHSLLARLCVKIENAVVTYYEVGVTMVMPRPATEYIAMAEEVGGRILWNDANYPVDRQKTTEKSKYYRKVLKIYDKTFEGISKGRKVGKNILRVESVYRHQSVQLSELISNETMAKIGRVFYNDWSQARFVRDVEPCGGVKMSQIDKAREILRLGMDRYREKYKSMYLEGKLTKKQWETIRNFARSWPEEKSKYKEVEREEEWEFMEKLLSLYQIGSVTPFSRKR